MVSISDRSRQKSLRHQGHFRPRNTLASSRSGTEEPLTLPQHKLYIPAGASLATPQNKTSELGDSSSLFSSGPEKSDLKFLSTCDLLRQKKKRPGRIITQEPDQQRLEDREPRRHITATSPKNFAFDAYLEETLLSS